MESTKKRREERGGEESTEKKGDNRRRQQKRTNLLLFRYGVTDHFHIFFAAAALETIRERIMSENMRFDDLVKVTNRERHIHINT